MPLYGKHTCHEVEFSRLPPPRLHRHRNLTSPTNPSRTLSIHRSAIIQDLSIGSSRALHVRHRLRPISKATTSIKLLVLCITSELRPDRSLRNLTSVHSIKQRGGRILPFEIERISLDIKNQQRERRSIHEACNGSPGCQYGPPRGSQH